MGWNAGNSGEVASLTMERPAGGFIRPYQSEIGLLVRVVDLLWLAATLWMSLALYDYGWTPRYTLLLAVSSILFLLSGEMFLLYRGARTDPLRVELSHVLATWATVVVAVLFLGYVFKVTHQYSRLGIGTWCLLAPTGLEIWRGLVRGFSNSLRRRGFNTRSVGIVGAGEQGLVLAETLSRAPWMGLRVLGIFDDRAHSRSRLPEALPQPLLGTTADLLDKARAGKLDIVYVTTIPISDRERIVALLEALSDTTVSVYIVPDLFLFSMFHGSWVEVGKLPAVSVFETPFYGAEGWVKRLEDLVISATVLTLMSVPMGIIALAVKLTSRGPVLFKQRRYGLDGKEFWIWKFRTMAVCEDGDDIRQARRGDARVTLLGRWLRRTSLDELPQFFNVAAGTMSVVGPRPHATAHNEHYRKLIKGYMVRHKVRPGITGWAQANGWRGETDTLSKMETRVEYDLWYIRNWSVLLDMKIILSTIQRLWLGADVY